jgi:hypothetical protein
VRLAQSFGSAFCSAVVVPALRIRTKRRSLSACANEKGTNWRNSSGQVPPLALNMEINASAMSLVIGATGSAAI